MFARYLGIALCAAACAAWPAAGQEAVFLTPSKHAAPAGEGVTLTLLELAGAGRAVVWDDERVAWSMVRIAGTQENSDRAPRADEKAAAGTVRLAQEGTAIIGVDFKPRVENLDAAAMKGVGGAPEKFPAGGAPVRLVQSAKTIVRIGTSEAGQSPTVTGKTGQQVELRPTFDPTGVGIGSDIPIVVYAGDGKVPGAKLTAAHVASGEKQEFIANDSAIGSFRLSKAGAWRIEVRHLAAAKDPKDGEPAWVLYTATLTFEAFGTKEEGK